MGAQAEWTYKVAVSNHSMVLLLNPGPRVMPGPLSSLDMVGAIAFSHE